jgi:hypothetical protein
MIPPQATLNIADIKATVKIDYSIAKASWKNNVERR